MTVLNHINNRTSISFENKRAYRITFLFKALILILTVPIFLLGCANAQTQSEINTRSKATATDIMNAMCASFETASMHAATFNEVQTLFGLDINLFDDYAIKLSDDAAIPNEIVIIKVADKELQNNVMTSLSRRADTVALNFKHADPNTKHAASKSFVKKIDDYIFLSIGQNSRRMLAILVAMC